MIIHSEQEMLDFGAKFQELLSKEKPSSAIVIELIGDVGVGKTTFTRGLAKGLGIKDPITSPSFTISKSYALPSGGHLIHYDFYRLNNPGLMSDDLEENLHNPKNIIIIEWGESVANLLPKDHIILNIEYKKDEERNVSLKNINLKSLHLEQ